jgi:hypothetical protein
MAADDGPCWARMAHAEPSLFVIAFLEMLWGAVSRWKHKQIPRGARWNRTFCAM